MSIKGMGIGSLLLLAAVVAAPPLAKADGYSLVFNGGGISGTATLEVSAISVPGVPGGYQVTGISGTFSDSTLGILNASITGLIPVGLPTNIHPDGTFIPPGSQADGYGFSWDNLFYPGGNSPAVCPPDPSEPPYPFGGGMFDIYGLLFTVNGGYTVDLWSNGVIPGFGLTYGIGDALDGQVLHTFGEPFSGESVDVVATPEPNSLLLLGTGVLGTWGVIRRRFAVR